MHNALNCFSSTSSSTELDAILADIEERENKMYSVTHYSEPPSEEELSGILIDPRPKTYEEWVAIHGEPEYIHESATTLDDLEIVVIDCPEEPIDGDMSDVYYKEDEKSKPKLNYGKFVEIFRNLNKCVFCNGLFYAPNGVIPDGLLRQDISETLYATGYRDKLDIPTNSIFTSLRDKAFVEELPINEQVIPFANGDLHLHKGAAWEFRRSEKKQAPYRLNVDYSPEESPSPLFDKWLQDLFDESDIPTVQEILGYALVPSTAVQEAFILVGPADAGKSIFGTILEKIWGNAFFAITTQELVTQRFQLSVTENKLVVYDDDLGQAALTETGNFKKLVTGDQKIPGERKFGHPYNFKPYCKIIACANFMLSALYDNSDGFFRRLHPIEVKAKDPNRRMIAKFGDKIATAEKEQIVRWALSGLKRLIDNGWEITWSERSRNYMGAVQSTRVHFQDFIDDVLECDSEASVSSAEIEKLYGRWTKANAIAPASSRRLHQWIKDNAKKNSMVFSTHIVIRGKEVRGYKCAAMKQGWKDTVHL